MGSNSKSRFFYYLLLVMIGVSAGVACNQKSDKKGGSAKSKPSPSPMKDTDYNPNPAPSPVPTVVGYNCQSDSIGGGDAKTFIIDTTQNKMQIRSSSGQQDYTLTPLKPAFFAPNTQRFEVAVSNGAATDKGHLYLDTDTKSFLGRDHGYYRAEITGVPYADASGTSKTINAFSLKCTKQDLARFRPSQL